MKIRLLSDLHLEHQPMSITQGDEDIVILAGDIHSGYFGLNWARLTFKEIPIIYLCGNHELYGHDATFMLGQLREVAAMKGIHFLENDQVTIGGIRFIGATLWSDFNLYGLDDVGMYEASRGISDYRVILDCSDGTEKKLTPATTKAWFHKSIEYFESVLATPFDGTTVVVTHFLPSERSVPERFRGSALNPYFASNLDSFIERHPEIGYWFHGHTHDSADYIIGGTRVVCNPAGYPRGDWRQNPNFDTDLIIEIE